MGTRLSQQPISSHHFHTQPIHTAASIETEIKNTVSFITTRYTSTNGTSRFTKMVATSHFYQFLLLFSHYQQPKQCTSIAFR